MLFCNIHVIKNAGREAEIAENFAAFDITSGPLVQPFWCGVMYSLQWEM